MCRRCERCMLSFVWMCSVTYTYTADNITAGPQKAKLGGRADICTRGSWIHTFVVNDVVEDDHGDWRISTQMQNTCYSSFTDAFSRNDNSHKGNSLSQWILWNWLSILLLALSLWRQMHFIALYWLAAAAVLFSMWWHWASWSAAKNQAKEAWSWSVEHEHGCRESLLYIFCTGLAVIK